MRNTKGSTIKESVIQKAILDYLSYRKDVRIWKQPSTGIFNAKGGGFIPTGMPGISDIIGIMKGGKWLAIEVKRPGGKVSDRQKEFISMINEWGGKAFVAYSVDDVIAQLK